MMPFAWAAVVVIAVVSSAMFVLQGGFGAGHLPLDRPIGILAMPWLIAAEKLVPTDVWSEAGDFVMIIILPFVCNVSVCGVIQYFAWALRRRKTTHRTTLTNKGDAAP